MRSIVVTVVFAPRDDANPFISFARLSACERGGIDGGRGRRYKPSVDWLTTRRESYEDDTE